jgi:hypothetical protein
MVSLNIRANVTYTIKKEEKKAVLTFRSISKISYAPFFFCKKDEIDIFFNMKGIYLLAHFIMMMHVAVVKCKEVHRMLRIYTKSKNRFTLANIYSAYCN